MLYVLQGLTNRMTGIDYDRITQDSFTALTALIFFFSLKLLDLKS